MLICRKGETVLGRGKVGNLCTKLFESVFSYL